MNKESKESLAKMYAFMNRMDSHRTMDEAKYIEKRILRESMFEDGTQTQAQGKGLFYPRAKVQVFVDHAKRLKRTRITIAPLVLQDANRIASKYMSEGAKFFTYERRGKKLAGIYVDINGTSLYTPNQRETNNDSTESNDGMSDFSDLFAGVFDAEELGQMNTANNDNDETDDEDDVLSDLLAGLSLNESIYEDDSTVNDTSSTDNSNTVESPKKRILKDKKMEKWFSTVYKNIVNDISKNVSAYDKNAIADLQDWETLFHSFLDQEYIDANFVEHQSADAITKAVLEALRSGNYAPLMNVLPVMNLQSMLFGSMLSARNITMAKYQSSGRAVAPTKLLGRTRWEKNFGRRVKDDAEPYIQMRPNAAYRKNANVQGLKGHANRFGTQYNNRYVPFLSYDISDTEDIDPNNPYDENAESNMVNNLTGELNQLAQDELAGREANTTNNLSAEDKALIEAVKTDDGRAKCYNEALLSFFKEEGYEGKCNVAFRPVNTIQDYIQNVINFWKGLVDKLPINKEEHKTPIIAIQAFAVCYFTQCPNDIVQNILRSNRIAISSNKNAQESDIQQLISTLEECINYIYTYWEEKFGTLRPDSGIDDSDDTIDTQETGVVSENKKFRNGRERQLEYLLENLFR